MKKVNNEKETIQNIENNNVENNVVQNEMNQNIVKNQDSSNQNMQEQITTNNNSNDEDSDTVNLKRVKDLIIAIILLFLPLLRRGVFARLMDWEIQGHIPLE